MVRGQSSVTAEHSCDDEEEEETGITAHGPLA